MSSADYLPALSMTPCFLCFLPCSLPPLSFVPVHAQLASSPPQVPSCCVLFCISLSPLHHHCLTSLLHPLPSELQPFLLTGESNTSHRGVFWPLSSAPSLISSSASCLTPPSVRRITLQRGHDGGVREVAKRATALFFGLLCSKLDPTLHPFLFLHKVATHFITLCLLPFSHFLSFPHMVNAAH